MITLRPMTTNDLAALGALEHDLFPDPWSPRMFRDSLCHAAVRARVAVTSAHIVGYVIGMLCAPEAEVLNIGVERTQQRCGVGTRLLEWMYAECRAQHVERVFLEVRASNTTAQQFYARHGFTLVGRRAGYYTVGREDALVLCRTLTS